MTDPRFMRPGLEFAFAKLVEELGELQSALGKTMRWGFASADPTKPTSQRIYNEDWIFAELDDVKQAIKNFETEFARTTGGERSTMFGYGCRSEQT